MEFGYGLILIEWPVLAGKCPPGGAGAYKLTLHLCLLRYFKGIIYFNAQVSDRAFQLGMTEQKLHCAEISCPAVD